MLNLVEHCGADITPLEEAGVPAFLTSPKELTKGMMYFPRMLDKIRLYARGELPHNYHTNLGAMKASDGVAIAARIVT
jgi:hypothetical protein